MTSPCRCHSGRCGTRCEVPIVICVQVVRLSLTVNQRVYQGGVAKSPESARFVEWLQRVGDGVEKTYNDTMHKDLIRVPSEMVVDTLPDLISFVFPDLADEESVAKSAILTPLKVNANMVNDIIIDGLPGSIVCLYSHDQCTDGAYPFDLMQVRVCLECRRRICTHCSPTARLRMSCA